MSSSGFAFGASLMMYSGFFDPLTMLLRQLATPVAVPTAMPTAGSLGDKPQ